MSESADVNGRWSSRLVYILAVTGVTVGFGNVWRFPYLVGENGGGLFILIYLGCLLLMMAPLMVAEALIGRRGRQNPLSGFATLAREAGAHRMWVFIGLLCLLTGLIIASYFSVFAGWSMAYGLRSALGQFQGVTREGSAALFSKLIADPERLLAWHTLFVALVTVISARGMKRGLEWMAKFLVPLMIALVLLLFGYGQDSGGLGEGVAYLLQSDPGGVSWQGALAALEQAFYTLSLGTGAVLAYAAYLPKGFSIGRASYLIVLIDTVIALLAGLFVYSIVFVHQAEVTMGSELVFEVLPTVFGQMRGGDQLGALFYLFMLLLALTSVVALIEPMVMWLNERTGCNRVAASAWSGGLVWLLGIVTLLSFNHWAYEFEYLGQSGQHGLFDMMVLLSAGVLLPFVALSMALFVGWVMSIAVVMEEMDMRARVAFRIWYFLLRFLVPPAIVLVVVRFFGVY